MRSLLEWLGLMEPQRGRRDPVALPTWGPLALAATATGAIYLLSLTLRSLLV